MRAASGNCGQRAGGGEKGDGGRGRSMLLESGRSGEGAGAIGMRGADVGMGALRGGK